MSFYKKIFKLFKKPNNNSKEIASGTKKKVITEHRPRWMYKNE